jgi:Calx-beta domain-containing protein
VRRGWRCRDGRSGTDHTANGTAIAGQDYTATAGTVTLGVGETTITITIPILADNDLESPETFTVTLASPTGGAGLGQQATITVTILDTTPAPSQAVAPPEDDTDKPHKETEDERRQREHTNGSGRDDYATEGNVVETRCDAAWPSVVIANRDRNVEVRLIKEAQAACSSVQVGDYLEADGEKQSEILFDADGITIWRGGHRVK